MDIQISNPEPKKCPCGDRAHDDLEDWFYSTDWWFVRNSHIQLRDNFNRDEHQKKLKELLPGLVQDGYCLSCRTLFDNLPDMLLEANNASRVRRKHFNNSIEMEAGYIEGCRLCRLFVQTLEEDGHSLEECHQTQKRFRCLGRSTSITCIFSRLKYDSEYHVLALCWSNSLSRRTRRTICYLGCKRKFSEEPSTLSNEKSAITGGQELLQIELAKKWLEACRTTHLCCRPNKGGRLPTRLIDVSCIPSHLVLTSSFPEGTTPAYATLSHCWGADDFLKLEEDSLDQFLKAIPEEIITKTCHDAIHVTRNLGIRYLWIDALCIIQNSQQDWACESALMGSVYEGSAVTIAADGAEDGTQGLFLKPQGYNSRVIHKVSENEIWDISAPRRFEKNVDESQLSTRAWALQERLLSPRILHFTKKELFWECENCKASDAFPEGLPFIPLYAPKNRYRRERKPFLYHEWTELISRYTITKLTFESDRLVAIGGLAQMAQKESGDEYLAGMWRRDIELQLIWSYPSASYLHPRMADYRGPSWSWASSCPRNKVGFSYEYPRRDDTHYRFLTHVQEAHVTLVRNDPFGELAGGVLKISCSGMLLGKSGKIKGRNHLPRLEIESLTDDDDYYAVRFNLRYTQIEGEVVFILPLVDMLNLTGPARARYRDPRTIEGILLLPTGLKKGEYIHAGSFRVRQYAPALQAGRLNKLSRFFELMETVGQTTAETHCAEVVTNAEFPDERYVITLV